MKNGFLSAVPFSAHASGTSANLGPGFPKAAHFAQVHGDSDFQFVMLPEKSAAVSPSDTAAPIGPEIAITILEIRACEVQAASPTVPIVFISPAGPYGPRMPVPPVRGWFGSGCPNPNR